MEEVIDAMDLIAPTKRLVLGYEWLQNFALYYKGTKLVYASDVVSLEFDQRCTSR
jgi:hypothetical protein